MDQLTAQMIYNKLMQQLGLGQTLQESNPYIGKPNDPTWGAAGQSTGSTSANAMNSPMPNGRQINDPRVFGSAGYSVDKDQYQRFLEGILNGNI